MEIGRLGLVGLHVQQLVAQQQSIVCDICNSNERTISNPYYCVGTRNCTGASNGGVCLGTALDTQLCDTNVSCSGEFHWSCC